MIHRALTRPCANKDAKVRPCKAAALPGHALCNQCRIEGGGYRFRPLRTQPK